MDPILDQAPLPGHPVAAGAEATTNVAPDPAIQAEQVFREVMNGKPVLLRDAKSVLTFSEGFAHKKLCSGRGPVLSCGDACVYNCRYCYVGSVARKFVKATLGDHAHQDVVIRRNNALKLLDDNLQKISRAEKDEKHVCFTSTLVDPAGNMDLVRETAAAVTMILKRTAWDIRILSKSNLLPKIAELIPKEFKHRVIYGVSVGTLDDGLAKAIETGTALVSKRLESLRWLQDNGYRTFGMICPSLPQDDYDQFSRDACAAIRIEKCEHVWAEPLNVRGESAKATIQALRGAGYNVEADMMERVFAPGHEQEWEDYAKATFEAHSKIIGPDKLRFLHYPEKGSLDWWRERRELGAILLGANASKVDQKQPPPADREQIVVAARPLGQALSAAIVPCTQLAELGIPQRAPLLGDWCKEGDYGMIVAPRGVGKTWMSLGIGVAIATGEAFGPWKAPAAQKVLVIDGEMPADELDQRIRGLGGDDNLLVLSHEAMFHQGGRSLNLARQEDQQEILRYVIKQGVKVLVLDNLSCLVSGLRENDGDAWEPMKLWFLELRRHRVAVVLVHHAGRKGEARGTSKREDDLFWALSLKETDENAANGARFKSTFTKNRNSARDEPDYNWAVSPKQGGGYEVTATPIEPESLLRELVERGETSATEIAKELGVAKGTVSKWAKAGCKAGWMHNHDGKYLPGPEVGAAVSKDAPKAGKPETKPKKGRRRKVQPGENKHVRKPLRQAA